jgi:hypothetical protein
LEKIVINKEFHDSYSLHDITSKIKSRRTIWDGEYGAQEREKSCVDIFGENLMEGSYLEDIAWILEIGWVQYGPDSPGPAFQEWKCSMERILSSSYRSCK